MVPIGNGTNAYVTSKAWANNAISHWVMEETAGLFLRDTNTMETIASDTVRYIELGENATLTDLGIRTELYGTPSGSITWTSGDTGVATLNSTGTVTSVSRGKITVTADAQLSDETYTQTYSVFIRETISVINLYDSTITGNSDILGWIDDAVDFLNIVYNESLYLYFVMDGEPQQWADAPVDICPTGASGQCQSASCGTDCLQHHKNLARISNELNEGFTRNQVIVFWSNCFESTYCYHGGLHDYCQPQSFYACVVSRTLGDPTSNIPVVQFLSINNNSLYSARNTRACMAVTLAHEVAHTLFLGEIYNNFYGDNDNHGNDPDSQYCIMNGISDNTETAYNFPGNYDILCEYCTGKLEEYGPQNAYETP